LTFLSDESAFLKGEKVFNILRLGFKLFSNEELVLLLEEKHEKEG
jgi:hypothetical protein